ncbi:MAG: ATP-binding protein [Desulfobulbaceae bacterium]|nr:ATP-binding protein [Desulfobulbaceae bacterium]
MDDVTKEEAWERAYLAQSHDAVVGRLFKGLIHNMNGVVQAFAMQGELFGMMFDQADGMLAEVLDQLPEGSGRAQAEKLRDLLYRRSEGVTLMEEKIHQGQLIMGRTLELVDFSPTAGVGPYTMNSVIRTEMEFLNADRFFKHGLRKELQLADDLPPLASRQVELHQAVLALLENSLDAVRDREDALLTISTAMQDGTVMVVVENNGPQIAPADLPRLFDPFFTTRGNRFGLGLYLAKRLVAVCNGDIRCEESTSGRTRFVLTVPADEGVAG